MTDCDKYKQFIEENCMMAFIIWEQAFYLNQQNGNNTTDITDIDINVID